MAPGIPANPIRNNDWMLGVALVPCLAIALTALFVVPHFRDMYEQFGAMLPGATTW